MKRILIVAGGTGGHIVPALTVASTLIHHGFEVAWLGSKHGLEKKILTKKQLNINLYLIDIKGLRGKGLNGWLKLPYQLTKALWQTRMVFKFLNPNLVLAMGGFVSGPGGIMAWFANIPLILHEQNAIAGMTNRRLLPLATHAFMGFPNSLPKKYASKSQYIGHPISESIKNAPSPKERWQHRLPNRKFHLLILGGSRGSLALNTLLPKALRLTDLSLNIWHQSGHDHLSITKLAYQREKIEACIEPFINDIAKAYAWADLVVCRAGAMTIAELATIGVGAILVPFPFAVDDHQTYNGQFLVEAGAAVMIQQHQLTPLHLANTIKKHCHHDRLLQMAIAAHRQACMSATDDMIAYFSSIL